VRPRSQQEWKRQGARRRRSRCNPFDGQRKIKQRGVRVAGCIFDGASDESRLSRKPDGLRHHFGCVAEPFFQISRDGQVGSIDKHARVRQRLFSSQAAILLAVRIG
jgi:hypothetical protein